MSSPENKNQMISLEDVVAEDYYGGRLDAVLADIFDDYSRSTLQQWLKNGWVKVNGEVITKPRTKVVGGEAVVIEAQIEASEDWKAADIPLDIVYEDDSLMIINKPPGLVVHPAAGHWEDTMVNGLLYYLPDQRNLPRAGIIHRLDKDTSGLLVVAKTLAAHHHLTDQLQQRAFEREYLALVLGEVVAGGTINAPIGRHRVKRKCMAVVSDGKEAITHYRIEEKLGSYTLLRVKLETGRTHQIRVHMSHIQHPIIGDQDYSPRSPLVAGLKEETRNELLNFKRQALHAQKLGLIHPQTDEFVCWEVPIPKDYADLLEIIRQEYR